VPLNLDDKKAIVAEVADVASVALSAAVADYRGLTVAELDGLRVKARHSGVYLRVVRNTLARRALEETDFACIKPKLLGPTILAFSRTEPSAAARLFKDFAKEAERFQVTGLAISGQLYEANEIDKLASLPTRDEAIARLMAVMQAPIAKFVRTLAEPHAKLTRTIAAIRDKKQAES
jgi:large subunit ribosomal protein L10